MGTWFNPEDFPEFWEKVNKVPKYLKWVDIKGCGGTGSMCNTKDFEKNKIFNTEIDEFPLNITTWDNCLNPEWYPNNFVEVSEKEYNHDFNINNIIDEIETMQIDLINIKEKIKFYLT